MPYTPMPFASFGAGLNLRDKVDAVSEEECIDCLNVEFTERGAVKQRMGYDDLTTDALTNAAATLFPYYTTGGTKQLLAGCGTRLEAISTAGAVVDSETGQTDGIWDFTMFGTPNSEIAYAGNGSDLLVDWNGTAWNDVSNTPKAGALATWATANRMVAGRFHTTTGGPTGGAGTSSPSHVYFSDQGSATAWTASNFVQLAPGDGEKITAIIEWRELVFVFKETKFFVFYGESSTAGVSVFNYRTIDTGAGAIGPRAVAADETGVYFASRQGVFRTTGGEPERVSDVIRPLWEGGTSDYWLGGEIGHASITNTVLWIHDEKLFVGVTTSGSVNNLTLIYDPRYDWWSAWDIPAAHGTSFRISNQDELVFADTSGTKEIMRMNSTITADGTAGTTAITSRWRSGWFDHGSTETKRIRQSKLWGSGQVSMGIAFDWTTDQGAFRTVDMTSTEETLDTWGGTTWGGGEWVSGAQNAAVVGRVTRQAIRGTVFSTTFQNTTLNQSWAVHRLDHHVAGQRIPSVVTATS